MSTPEEENSYGNKSSKFIWEKSSWEPKSIHHNVNTFIDAVTKDLENHPKSTLPKSKNEREAIAELAKRDAIIISKAEKGGSTVFMSINDYIIRANKELNNPMFYKKLDFNPTEQYNTKINKLIDIF